MRRREEELPGQLDGRARSHGTPFEEARSYVPVARPRTPMEGEDQKRDGAGVLPAVNEVRRKLCVRVIAGRTTKRPILELLVNVLHDILPVFPFCSTAPRPESPHES